MPIPVPFRVDIRNNVALAERHKFEKKWFEAMVKNKGPWDYKQGGSQYEPFGNFNFGATGTALGFPQQILLRGAGYAQGQAGTSQPGWGIWYGFSPYGDDPVDQFWITAGIACYQQGVCR